MSLSTILTNFEIYFCTSHIVCCLQGIQNFSFSEVEGGKGGATEGHVKDEKGSSNVGRGTYEYRKVREVEVRCCGMGGGGSKR